MAPGRWKNVDGSLVSAVIVLASIRGSASAHRITPMQAVTAVVDASPAPGILLSASHPTAPTYTVVPGDSLWDIAESHYGNGEQWHSIYDANVGVLQPDGRALDATNWIYPGWKLAIPNGPAPAPAPIAELADTSVPATPAAITRTVAPGDSLVEHREDLLRQRGAMARHLRRQRRSRPTRWHGAVRPVPHLPRLDAHHPSGRVSATSVIPLGGSTSPSPGPVSAHSPAPKGAGSRATHRCEPNFGSVTDATPCVALSFASCSADRTRAPAAGEWSSHRGPTVPSHFPTVAPPLAGTTPVASSHQHEQDRVEPATSQVPHHLESTEETPNYPPSLSAASACSLLRLSPARCDAVAGSPASRSVPGR